MSADIVSVRGEAIWKSAKIIQFAFYLSCNAFWFKSIFLQNKGDII